jgi:hypothetical protein
VGRDDRLASTSLIVEGGAGRAPRSTRAIVTAEPGIEVLSSAESNRISRVHPTIADG